MQSFRVKQTRSITSIKESPSSEDLWSSSFARIMRLISIFIIFVLACAVDSAMAAAISPSEVNLWSGAPVEIYELKGSKKIFLTRSSIQEIAVNLQNKFQLQGDLELRHYYMKDELLAGICFRKNSAFCISKLAPFDQNQHMAGGIFLFSYDRYQLPRLPETLIRTELIKAESNRLFFKSSVIGISETKADQTSSSILKPFASSTPASGYSKNILMAAPASISKNFLVQKISYKKNVRFFTENQMSSKPSEPSYFNSWDQPQFSSTAVFALGLVENGNFQTVGTGFFISDSGLALTNHHVLNAFGTCFEKLFCDLFIRTQISKTKYKLKSVRLKVLAADDEYDFALFETRSTEGPIAASGSSLYKPISTPQFLKLDLQNAEESIFSVGYPVLAGGVQTSSIGKVLMLTSRYNFSAMNGEVKNWNSQLGLYYQTSLLGGQGNSGSPVFGINSKKVQGLIARGMINKFTDNSISKVPLLLQAVSMAALEEQFGLSGYLTSEKKNIISSILKQIQNSDDQKLVVQLLKKFEAQKTFLGTEELYRLSYESSSREIRKLLMTWLTTKGFVRTSYKSADLNPATEILSTSTYEAISNSLSKDNRIVERHLYHYRVEEKNNPVEQGYVVFNNQQKYLRPSLPSGDMTDFLCFPIQSEKSNLQKSCELTFDKEQYFRKRGFSFPVQVLRGILPNQFKVLNTFLKPSEVNLNFLSMSGQKIAEYKLLLSNISVSPLQNPVGRLGLQELENDKIDLPKVSQNIIFMEVGADRSEVHLIDSRFLLTSSGFITRFYRSCLSGKTCSIKLRLQNTANSTSAETTNISVKLHLLSDVRGILIFKLENPLMNWPNTKLSDMKSKGPLLSSSSNAVTISGKSSDEGSESSAASLVFVRDWKILSLSPKSQILDWRSTYTFGYQKGLMFLDGTPTEIYQKNMAGVFDIHGSFLGLTYSDQNNIVVITSAELLRELYLVTSPSGYAAQHNKSLAVIKASSVDTPGIIISLNELAQTHSISFRAPLLELIVNEANNKKRSLLGKSYQQLGLTRLAPL